MMSLATSLYIASVAQSPKWAIEPVYTSIAEYNDTLLKVYSSRGVTLMNYSGRDVLSAHAAVDSITDFKNGYALLLRYEDGKQRLSGVLNSDFSVTPILEQWYVGEYPYFSEQLLPVYNEKDKYGFIDPSGRVAVKFGYAGVHPFKEGRASVFKSKSGFMKLVEKTASAVGVSQSEYKVAYVNPLGNELKLSREIGDIYFGSSFRYGEALVRNKDGQYFVIDINGMVKRLENAPNLEFDDDYAIKSGYYEKEQPKMRLGDSGIKYFMENDLYGFRKRGEVIVPAQFVEFRPFAGEYAFVRCKSGKWGVLTLDEQSIDISKKVTAADSDDEEAVDFIIKTPEVWKDKLLMFTCVSKTNGATNRFECFADGTLTRTISFILPKGERDLTLIGDHGLIICQYNDAPKKEEEKQAESEVKVSVYPGKVKANAKNNAVITVTIDNVTSKTQKLNVSIVGQQLSGGSYKLTLKAGEKKSYRATFTNVVATEKRRVTVTVGEKKVNRTVEVEPFIVF